MHVTKNTWYILVILILSLATRFAFFGHPAETVFDEVHFGKYIDSYSTGEYYFDIHPPLGKMMIAGASKLGGYQAGDFTFDDIGTKYQNNVYKTMRAIPSLAGALLPLVIYLLALQLGFTRNGAALAAVLTIFENGLITQSRFILMDSFMLLFGFSALYFYTKKNFWAAGILGACAGAIKWTGLSFIGIIGILYFIAWLRETNKGKHALVGVLTLIILPIIVYYSIFALHFKLLPNPGPGDAFMSQEFRDGNLSTLGKFTNLNKVMYTANKGLSATHPFSSVWYEWPINKRAIFYWHGAQGDIWFIGNPLVWIFALIGIIYTIVRRPKTSTQKFLIFGYFVNLLPFMFIGRVMFLYHYFPSLIFAILALAYFLDRRIKKIHYIGLVFMIFVAFIIIAPFTYGVEAPEFILKISKLFI